MVSIKFHSNNTDLTFSWNYELGTFELGSNNTDLTFSWNYELGIF